MRTLEVSWFDAPVSRVAMGCELLGGSDWGEVDTQLAISAVRAAYEAGINVFDTADVYGLGRSEQLLSQALGPRINDVAVVTKGGVAWTQVDQHRAETRRDLSLGHLSNAVEDSLRRLRIEQIPLYLAHWPDGIHGADVVVETLESLRQRGLIAHYGLSNFPEAELQLPGVLDHVSALEVEYSLIRPSRRPFINGTTGPSGPSVLAYGCLAQGLLTGKYSGNARFPTSDRRHRLPHFQDRALHGPVLGALDEVTRQFDVTHPEAAIRWVLDSAEQTIAVVGARTPAQVKANIRAGSQPLDPAALAKLTDAVAEGSGE